MFYIQPPRGVLALNTLTSCIETRIQYLELIYNKNNVDSFEGNIEYLFEGSKYDRTGHFILRLTSHIQLLFSFLKFIIKNCFQKDLNFSDTRTESKIIISIFFFYFDSVFSNFKNEERSSLSKF